MKPIIGAVALLAFATLGCEGPRGATGPAGPAGQDGTPGQNGTPGTPGVDKGMIGGTVRDAQKQPIAGVAITTVPASTTAMSDASGVFKLTDVPVGTYSVVAAKAGYTSYTLAGVGVAGGILTNISLALTVDSTLPGTISGTITDARADTNRNIPANPIAGATVTAEGQTASAVTDAQGHYTLSGVVPGPVFVAVASPDPSQYLPTETREAVDLAPGDAVTGVDLILSSRPSDAATYVGMNDSGGCANACHGANNQFTGNKIKSVSGSAHNRSLTRIARDATYKAVAGAWTRLLNPTLTKPRTVMIPLAGTIAVTGGATTVTGTGTAFSSGGAANALAVGDTLGYTPVGLGWTPIGTVQAIADDTHLTLAANPAFAPGVTSLAGAQYSVARLSSNGHTHMWPEGSTDIVAPAWPGVKATNPNYEVNDPNIYGGASKYADGQVNVYLCNLKDGVTFVNDEYAMKFGGLPYTCADGSFWDGVTTPAVPLVRIDVIYGGQGDKDAAMVTKKNVGVFKQRYQGHLADIKAVTLWSPPYTSTADRDRDSLTLPIQVLESGDRVNGGFKMNGYHPTEQKFPGESWTQRTRTFSHACAGCHATGLTIDWDMTTINLQIPRDGTITTMTNAAIKTYSYKDENITCEHCHGPGSEHVIGGGNGNRIINPAYLTADAERQVCGKCHAYDDATNAKPEQTYGFEFPWNTDWSNKIGNGNFVAGVFNLSDSFDNWAERLDDDEALWDPGKTGGKLYGQAHRQQYTMLSYAVHTNNPYEKVTCTKCHSPHSAGLASDTGEQGASGITYDFNSLRYETNVLCLSCHREEGPFVSVTVDSVAAVHAASPGGTVKKDGVAWVPDAPTLDAAQAQIAAAVSQHMTDKAKMSNVVYDPTNEAMPTGRCTSCHMPKVAKSGGYYTGLDFNGNEAVIEGDQSSHVFDIIWPYQATALSRGGPSFQSGYYGQTIGPSGVKYDKFTYMPNSCSKCHTGARKASLFCPDTATVWPSYWPFNDATADPNGAWPLANCFSSLSAP
jgi:hypothetical protein